MRKRKKFKKKKEQLEKINLRDGVINYSLKISKEMLAVKTNAEMTVTPNQT